MSADAVINLPNLAAWPLRPLHELCEIISRGTAPRYVEDSRVRAIGQRCVTHGGFDPTMARGHSERPGDAVLIAAPGDVLLNSTGTGTIGRSCVFDGGGTFMVDGHVTVLRPTAGRADGQWLNAVLRTPWGQSFLETRCYSGSTNQVELSRTRLAEAGLPTPVWSEQRQIATILETIDDAIRKTEQIVAKLKQVKQGLLHDLLTCGIDDNGELRDPERHPEQFKDSPLGRIPRAWTAEALEELTVAPICYGIVQAGAYVPEGPFVLTIGDLNGDFQTSLHRTSRAIDQRYARSRTQPSDVLLSIKGTIGRVAVVPDWYVGNISRDMARLRFSPRINPKFAKWYFESPMGQRRLELSVVGTTRAEISIHVLKRLALAVPSNGEQDRIVLAVANAHRRVSAEERALRKLQDLKQGLMADLLTGRVRATKLVEHAAE